MEVDEIEMTKEELQRWIRTKVKENKVISADMQQKCSLLKSLLERREKQAVQLMKLCKSVAACEAIVRKQYSLLGWEYPDSDDDDDDDKSIIGGHAPPSQREFKAEPEACSSPTSNVHAPLLPKQEDSDIKDLYRYNDKNIFDNPKLQPVVVLIRPPPSSLRPPPPQTCDSDDESFNSSESSTQWEPDEDSNDSDYSVSSFDDMPSKRRRIDEKLAESRVAPQASTHTGAKSNTAKTSAPHANGKSNAAKTSAPHANDKSNAAKTSAPHANDRSNAAKTSAPHANDKSNAAKTAAPHANDKSNAAKTSAPHANDKSNAAKTSAPHANDKSNAAKTAAPHANDKSNAAKTSAPHANDKSNAAKTAAPHANDKSNAAKTSAPHANDKSNAAKTSAPHANDKSNAAKTSAPHANDKSNAAKTSAPHANDKSNAAKTSAPHASVKSNTTKTSTPQTSTNTKAKSKARKTLIPPANSKAQTGVTPVGTVSTPCQSFNKVPETPDAPSGPPGKIRENMNVLARRTAMCWQQGKIAEIITKENGKLKYKINFENGRSLVSGHHVAFDCIPKGDQLLVGTRVVVKSKDEKPRFCPGIVAEVPGRKNHMRFLVFLDDLTPVYVALPFLYLVCRPLADPLDDIPDDRSKKFLKEYLESWPYPPQTHYRAGQMIRAELNGFQQRCEVLVVDSSIIQVLFQKEQCKQWIYRGSPRLEHMIKMREHLEVKKEEEQKNKSTSVNASSQSAH